MSVSFAQAFAFVFSSIPGPIEVKSSQLFSGVSRQRPIIQLLWHTLPRMTICTRYLFSARNASAKIVSWNSARRAYRR